MSLATAEIYCTINLVTTTKKGKSNLTKGDIVRLLSISTSIVLCHVTAAILNLIQPEIAPLDLPILKTQP